MTDIPLGATVFWPLDDKQLGQECGWVLCNGKNNAPDYRGRFIMGAEDVQSANNFGLSSFISHSHSYASFPASTNLPVIGGGQDLMATQGESTNDIGFIDAEHDHVAADAEATFDLKFSSNESRPSNISLHCATLQVILAADDNAAILPIGTVIAWKPPSKESSVPKGWLQCDGAALDQKAYPTLACCLTAFKRKSPVDSNETTYLPDLCGLFVRGVQSAKVNNSLRPADPDFEERFDRFTKDSVIKQGVGSYQDSAISQHDHGYPSAQFNGQVGGWGSGFKPQFCNSDATSNTVGKTEQMTPAYVTLLYIIKALYINEAECDATDQCPPIGSIIMYAGDENHVQALANSGWSLCDGSRAVNRLPGLGMNKLPDLTGLFVRVTDEDGQIDKDASETRFQIVSDDGSAPKELSEQFVGPLSLQLSALEKHEHLVNILEIAPVIYGTGMGHYGFAEMFTDGWQINCDTRTPALNSSNLIVQDFKATVSTETRPPNLALYFLISCGLK